MPPGLREEGEAGEKRVGENGKAESAAAAEAIPDAAEETAAERPADEEGGLNDRGMAADAGIGGIGHAEELGDKWERDECVEVHVQAVEEPTEPRGDAGFPLLGGDFAEVGGVAEGRGAGFWS